ncbi:unnamed protein product, partial [Mesorhabditis spiculigera]
MASQMALQEKVLLGQGAFGLVYRLHAKSRVAVKELRGSREEHERELSALKELAHPNIVNFLDATPDYVPDDPYCYLIFMDYCDYGSLEKVIIDPKIIYTAATIVSWAMEIILVADLFRLKLSDFGISRPVDNLVRHEGAGTHGYMAPEILEAIGNRNDTPAKQMRAEDIYKCDTYSAGVVVWEIMKRRCLVEDCTMRPTAKQILTDLATLRYAYPLDPVMRRSQKRLLKPIGLDVSAWIGATKVDFSELKVMLEELSKRFRPQEKRSVLLEALVCQMTNNKFDLETVDIEERDKHYRCKMPLLMKQFWRPRAFMGLLALPRFHTHWGLALGIWILSGICPAIACCYCMRRCVISIQRKFVFLTPDYEN